MESRSRSRRAAATRLGERASCGQFLRRRVTEGEHVVFPFGNLESSDLFNPVTDLGDFAAQRGDRLWPAQRWCALYIDQHPSRVRKGGVSRSPTARRDPAACRKRMFGV